MISLVLAAALSAPPAEKAIVVPSDCSMAWTAAEYLRRSRDTWAVASVLPEAVTDTSRFRPFTGLARDTTTPGLGRLVRIESVAGEGADGIAAAGSTVAVFVWSLGMDCRLTSGAYWLDAPESQHFTMSLRPDSAWVAPDLPTFDVSPFGLGNYPLRGNREGLSVQQYAEMVMLIPQEQDWVEDCRPGIRRLNRWMWDHGRPFKQMIVSLVGLCEGSMAEHARSHERYGTDTVPLGVEAWASRSDCTVSRAWPGGPVNAVSGRFLPGPNEQWAVICAYDGHWRLVVLDAEADTELAELTRMTGSPEYWQITAASPAYFDWAPLGRSEDDPDRLPNPEHDSILLSGVSKVAFYRESGGWTGLQHDCCAWQY